MKKALLLLSMLLVVFGIIACDQLTTTVPVTTATTGQVTTTTGAGTTTTHQTTTQPTTTTGPTTTAFSIALSGLDDAGYTDEDKIYANQLFDLLAGVHAYGSDGVDYKDNILLQSDDAACQIDDDGMLMSTSAKNCIITYTVVVQSKMARATRNVKISAAPITIEFTETDLIDNAEWFADGAAIVDTTWDGTTPYVWNYWTANAAVLGTTGSIAVVDGKLVIVQEDLGGVNYGLQAKMLTDIALVEGTMYKITFTLTSTSDRYIDIVTKAPNNNYALDTHSIIEVKTGTFDYEMVFTANQTVLHMNIMTGVVESSVNAGTLEFSNFVLWEGPLVIEYEELADFFTNADIATGTMIDYITTTDADYVREFYYWDQNSGALMTGEIIENGIEVNVLTQAANDYGIQLQWNDMTKQGTKLIKDANYKFTFNVNASVARTMVVAVTGSVNALPSSGSQTYELSVGDNAIVIEFVSLYDYFFTKIQFGNYGDLVQTGTFTLTNFQLWQDVNATETEEPVDPNVIIGNVFGTIANVNATALGVESVDLGTNWQTSEVVEIPTNLFYLWHGIEATGWFTWAEYPALTANYVNSGVELDITAAGTEFWSIQLKFKGSEALIVDVDYVLAFKVYSSTARRIGVQIKDAAFAGAYVDQNVDLVVGYNLVEIPFKAQQTTLNIQINLGTFTGYTGEEGTLRFDSFYCSRPTQEVVGAIANGDFATDAAFAAADANGWAYWSTQGIPDAWALPNYIGTGTIAGGVMTAVTTQTGGAVWGHQFQYNDASGYLMKVGAVYKVEFDVNSDTATTICVELKYDDNSQNRDVVVPVVVGDNHVTVYYVATQARFRLFVMLGLSAPSTMVFDNFKLSEPVMPEEPVIEEVIAVVPNGIFNGDFAEVGFEVNGVGSGWTSWTTVGESSWTKAIDATFAVTDGAVVIDIIDDATNHGVGDHVWSIQFGYKPGASAPAIVPDKNYVVEFDVNATVAGQFSMEMTTTGNVANYAELIDLVAGDNHVVFEFTAYEEVLMLTLCLGKYGPATLTIDNFVLSGYFAPEEVKEVNVPVEDGIYNGDFAEVGFAVNGVGSGWTSWTTVGESSWTKAIDATFTVTDGAVVIGIIDDATNHGVGDHVWSIQFGYKPGASAPAVIPGNKYVLEFDVNASVAGQFSMEMTTTGNVANYAELIDLVAGDNHVVFEFTAYEEVLMLTLCIGKYGPATLTVDNFVLNEVVTVLRTWEEIENGIFNGDFAEVGFAVNGIDTGWTSWTTVGESSWTKAIDATFTVTDGAVVIGIIDDATNHGVGDHVWSIQFGYKPTDFAPAVIPGQVYRVEFDVNATVAGQFSMEMTTTGNVANYAELIDLVAGDNHVVFEFTAYEEVLMLTLCIGKYGPATLTVDNFKLYTK